MKKNRGFPDGQIRGCPGWGAHPGGPEEELLHRAGGCEWNQVRGSGRRTTSLMEFYRLPN